MGGNTVVVRGGPFLEGETVVDVDGEEAELTSLTQNEITFAAPKQSGDTCGVGNRGILAKVWNSASSHVWEPLFADPEVSEVDQASFAQKGKWTAHLEGYFMPPSDGYYSFLVAANQEGRLFFSRTGCATDARLVTDVRNSKNEKDFFGESRRAVMEKAFMKQGKEGLARNRAVKAYS